MSRAIQLGANALGTAAPNPMVGAVLVYEERIIGEGYTSPFGGPHAEVNAIGVVRDRDLLSRATLYVTLEPCAHYGKTPPCTHLIIKHAIPEVVIGLIDPHDKVAGQGVKQLKAAGCRVVTGVLEAACREHHRRFLCLHEKKRPYIILKWAQSSDGFLAPTTERRGNQKIPYWVSNIHARRLVHQWRCQEQAILVGSTTVVKDNPQLTSRLWKGKSPFRIVLDKDLEVAGNFHVLDQSQPTLIIHGVRGASQPQDGISYEYLDFDKPLQGAFCEILRKYDITSLLVEGGAQTLQSFIGAGLWDEARIFSGTAIFGEGLKAPAISGKEQEIRQIGNNTLRILRHD